MSTLIFGNALRIWRVASRPFRSGMAMSMTTTSGRCSFVRITDSRPSRASATTSISPSGSSRARRPSRAIVWSSASRTLMGFMGLFTFDSFEGKTCGNGGALAGRGGDLEDATDHLDALAHADKAEPPVSCGIQHMRHVEGSSIVMDLHEHRLGHVPYMQAHACGLGVLGSVDQGSLGHAEKHGPLVIP